MYLCMRVCVSAFAFNCYYSLITYKVKQPNTHNYIKQTITYAYSMVNGAYAFLIAFNFFLFFLKKQAYLQIFFIIKL